VDKTKYIKSLLEFRKQKDAFFRSQHSPLTVEQQYDFQGLKYFDPNLDYRFSVKINEFKERKVVNMLTSTGDTQEHYIFGTISFEIDGKIYTLQVYTSERNLNYYFVPFTDLTSGTESYGAGKYVELEPDADNFGRFILDFNMAYSPYCAYNENYSCPIPPKENRLQVKIPAGEKKYHEDEE
jgi:hypothetical protein